MKKNFKELGQILAENSRDIAMIADSILSDQYLVIPVGDSYRPLSIDEALVKINESEAPCALVRVVRRCNSDKRVGVVIHALSRLNKKKVFLGRVNEAGLIRCTDVDNPRNIDHVHKSFIREVKL